MLFLTNIDWAWNIAKKLYILGYGLNENPILFCGYSASKWLRVLRILLKCITKRITTFFCIGSPINWLQIFGGPNQLIMWPCPFQGPSSHPEEGQELLFGEKNRSSARKRPVSVTDQSDCGLGSIGELLSCMLCARTRYVSRGYRGCWIRIWGPFPLKSDWLSRNQQKVSFGDERTKHIKHIYLFSLVTHKILLNEDLSRRNIQYDRHIYYHLSRVDSDDVCDAILTSIVSISRQTNLVTNFVYDSFFSIR
jgi:hypothetical protein